MSGPRFCRLLGLATLAMTACAAPIAGGGTSGAPSPESPRQPSRTLVVALKSEPQTIAAGFTVGSTTSRATPTRLFNAALDLVDDRGVARPYLAENIPQLNTETWRVLPDGTMETRYQLLPNLTWQDGAPLTADDFVFAWQVDLIPELGLAALPPLSEIEDVQAPDSRTVAVRWKRTYPGAGVMQVGSYLRGLVPFPRHIMERPFLEKRWDAFSAHPYWTTEFIGLGPYKLDRWEPGAFLEGVAFDGHALGRPKIDRVKIVIISDAGTALASMLAEEIHMVADNSIDFVQAKELKRQWASNKAGEVFASPQAWFSIKFQLRPELANPRVLMDSRVRRAMAFGIDRKVLTDVTSEEIGMVADTIFLPTTPYYQRIDQAITKYPYDLRRAGELMLETGASRGPDGVLISPTDGRLTLELLSNTSPTYASQRTIIADGWRQAGFEVREGFTSNAGNDRADDSRFPGTRVSPTGLQEDNLVATFTSAAIPTPENRYSGTNTGAWSNAEFDVLANAFGGTLDPEERIGQRVRMAQILTEEMPTIPINWQMNPVAFVAGVTGVAPTTSPGTTGVFSWNVHEWEFR
ncbi:MAG: hypothetical protein HW416_3726 [Chloroflexi bacterium]|nr:hypothetical protein [Chloroflexota bacterium]